MSDSDEKRHEATPAKRRRAHREGNVARSAELTSVAAFGAATLAAAVAIPFGVAAAITTLRQAANDTATVTTKTPTTTAVAGIAGLACAAMIPLAAAASAGALAAFAQTGGLHLTPLHLDLKRLDPIAGLKRMLGADAAVALARAALAFAAALLGIVPIVRDVIAAGPALGSPGAAAAFAGAAALRACGTAFAVGAVFAIADYALARRRWLRGLRMSFEELKRDAKENDGDPHARARRKSAHRAVVRGTVGRTREASFVVVNPTHVAVALRYAPPAVPVPEILVRAVDGAALRVRAIAREHRIPVVENVALARLLYAQGESGRTIPPEAYVAVAHVVAALARDGLLA